MRNFIQPGEVLTLTAPTGGVVSGGVYKIGLFIVVAASTVAQTLPFEGKLNGVFDVPKATGQAWTEGALVYWDDTAKNFTTTVGTNTLAGKAARLGGEVSGATTGRVRLTPG